MSRCWIRTDGAYWQRTLSPLICQQCCPGRWGSSGHKTTTRSDYRLSSPSCGGTPQREHRDSNDPGWLPLAGSRAKQAEQNPSLCQDRKFSGRHCLTYKTGRGRIWCPNHCTPRHSTKHRAFYHQVHKYHWWMWRHVCTIQWQIVLQFTLHTVPYDRIRDAILTCARKPTWVSLIYCMV